MQTIRANRAMRSNIAVARQPGRKGRGDHHEVDNVPVVLREPRISQAGRCEPGHNFDDRDRPGATPALAILGALVTAPRSASHAHFRVWTPVPVLGVTTSVLLLTQQSATVWSFAAMSLAVGLILHLLAARRRVASVKV